MKNLFPVQKDKLTKVFLSSITVTYMHLYGVFRGCVSHLQFLWTTSLKRLPKGTTIKLCLSIFLYTSLLLFNFHTRIRFSIRRFHENTEIFIHGLTSFPKMPLTNKIQIVKGLCRDNWQLTMQDVSLWHAKLSINHAGFIHFVHLFTFSKKYYY